MIELMIAIAVVALLLALAVPAYNDYTIRSKVAECINGAAVGKLGISEYRQTLGGWPPSLEAAGLTVSGLSHYCTSLDDYDPVLGSFTVNVNEAAIDSNLGELAPVLEPLNTPSSIITWNCKRGITAAENARYLPSTCRDI